MEVVVVDLKYFSLSTKIAKRVMEQSSNRQHPVGCRQRSFNVGVLAASGSSLMSGQNQKPPPTFEGLCLGVLRIDESTGLPPPAPCGSQSARKQVRSKTRHAAGAREPEQSDGAAG
eukprot:945528-Pyramimonas_sp.AAC.2